MLRALRLVVLVLTAAVAAVATAESARPALFFFFEPTVAKPGDRVSVRTAGTPVNFRSSQRVKPLQRAMRLYLVSNADAGRVRTRFDPRLHFIGSLVPDTRGRGSLTFAVPPVETGSYAAAVWCPGCARSSRGRTFFVLDPAQSRYRALMLLRVTAPPATADSCPATIPDGRVPRGVRAVGWTFHGNRLLAAALPANGTYVDDDGDGSVSTKMIWVAGGLSGDLDVRYRRIDVPAAAVGAHSVRGTLSGFEGPSWASRMHFTEGCWKVTGRVRDISLSFTVRVAR